MNIPALAHPRHFQSVGDIDGCQHLWIDERVDAHILEERMQVRGQILHIIYTRHRLLGAQGMSYHAGIHVTALVRSHAHKQVGMLCSGLFQGLYAGGRSVQRHNVVAAVQSGQTFYVIVYQHTVLMVFRQ